MSFIRRGIAVVLALLLALGMGAPLATAVPDAVPAETGPITAVLDTTKTVADSELTPGQQTVYTLTAGCTSGTTLCEGAVLADMVPAPLVVETVQVSGAFAHDATVSLAGEGNREITVNFASRNAATGAVGLKDGSTTTILVTVRLPQDVSAEFDGTTLLNTVNLTATNANPKSAEAVVGLKVPTTFGADISKAWSQANLIAGIGGENNVSLSNIKNTSNIGASSLTIVEPSGSSNPFDVVGFAGFGNVVFPAGADKIQVNAVTADGKVEGIAADAAALPAGVANDQVKGLEFIFTSSENTATMGGIHANGGPGSISFKTTVPATATAATINNEVSITAQTPKGNSEPKTAQAPFTITDARYAVSAGKSFSQPSIIKGGSSAVTLTGTNNSDQPLTSMTITEPKAGTVNPFTATPGMTFTGFAATSWPAGAETATLVVNGRNLPVTKGNDGTVVFPADLGPDAVTSFSLTYTGSLARGVNVAANFTVTGDAPGDIPNTVGVSGTAPEGATGPEEAQSTAKLTVQDTKVVIKPSKVMAPSEIEGSRGQQVVATLTGTVHGASNSGTPSIVLIDQFSSEMVRDWKATTVTVDRNASEDVSVEVLQGETWNAVTVPAGGTVIKLPAGAEGVKITYTKNDGTLFNIGAAVKAEVALELTADVGAASYTNVLTIAGQDGESSSTVATNNRIGIGTNKSWNPNKISVTAATPQPTSVLDVSVDNKSHFPVDSLEIHDAKDGTSPFNLVDMTGVRQLGLPRGVDTAVLTLTVDGAAVSAPGANAKELTAGFTAEQWSKATAFTVRVEAAGAIAPNAQLFIKIDTKLRTETRVGKTPMAQALKALERAYTIPNTMTGTVSKTGKDDVSRESSAGLTVETAESISLRPELVKTFSPQSATMFDGSGKPKPVTTVLTVKNVGDRPDVVLFEEEDPTFFNAFDFGGWSEFKVADWSGNDNIKAEIQYLTGGTFAVQDKGVVLQGGVWGDPVPFVLHNSSELVNQANAAMPEGVTTADVQGFRVKYSTVDGSDLPQMRQAATNAEGQSVAFAAVPRYTLHTGEVNSADGKAINPGESAASTVNNTASVATSRDEVTSVPVKDDADFVFAKGEAKAAVSKTDNSSLHTTTFAGGLINYTLVLKNTGTEPLTNPVFKDVLPVDDMGAILEYKPEEKAATFAKSPETVAITTDPEAVTTTYVAEGPAPSVAFSFPDGSVLLPGESYTVTLPLYVRAGMPPRDGIANNLTVTTDQLTVDAPPALVKVVIGQSYEARKLVREVLAEGQKPTGVHNVLGEDRSCDDYGDGFYRYPCVVETKPGADAEWKIAVTNTGNVPTNRLEFVDILPFVGDHLISPDAVELARNSEWLPTFKELLDVQVPQGATATVKYLVGDPSRCVANGAKYSDDPWGEGCADSLFTEVLPDDASTVTGFKITFDFETPLPPLGSVDVRFLTTSATKMPAGVEDLAPAWNTFAYVATSPIGNNTKYWQQEPNQTGITFRSIPDMVSVGDYVWVDTDRDGVQGDPVKEPGIQGVVLVLTGPDGKPVTDVFGNPVGPVTTDKDGKYTFENLPVLKDDQFYTVSIDRDASKEALAPYIPTIETEGNREGDSSTWTASSVGLTADGERDASLDFGFVLPKVSVGDYVWLDSNGDGRQDAGEPGIQDVVLVLTGPDGKPVTDVFGNPVGPVATDKDGRYTFENLPVLKDGQSYTVSIDKEASAKALAPYQPTLAGRGDRDGDSSTWSATSGNLLNDGDRDPSLDFGFVLIPEPVTPVDPTDPPVVPVDPTDPPVVPVDPTDPPVVPVDPTDPTDPPVVPVDPTDPTDPPVVPVDPTDPPVVPVEPTDPPVVPVDPAVTTPAAPEPATPAATEPGAATAPATTPATTAPTTEPLSNTGFSGAMLMGIGLLLTLLGGGAVALTVRRRRTSTTRH